MRFLLSTLACLSLAPYTSAQTALQTSIANAAAAAQGKVAVSCSLPGTALRCDLNAQAHPPMQSVFKLPLALFVLSEVEQGRIVKQGNLQQTIRFEPADLIPQAYSPLQDKYPQANVDVPLAELLHLSVAYSDNVAADILLRLVGGPEALTGYVASLGVRGFHLEDGEHGQNGPGASQQVQYRNWFEPAGAVALLRRLADRSPLTPAHTRLLLGWMGEWPMGRNRLGEIGPDVPVMHKSGTSGTHDGLTNAYNDIALIGLPDGRRLALAVFLTDSRADAGTRDAVIARIGRLAYEAAVKASAASAK